MEPIAHAFPEIPVGADLSLQLGHYHEFARALEQGFITDESARRPYLVSLPHPSFLLRVEILLRDPDLCW